MLSDCAHARRDIHTTSNDKGLLNAQQSLSHFTDLDPSLIQDKCEGSWSVMHDVNGELPSP